ncbi:MULTISPECIES: hypothetical protein [Methylomonas]|nr:hypothetical protein [Methylomonas koyamae]
MNKSYAIIHWAQAIIGIIFGLFVANVSYANSIEGRPDLTPIRAILSIVLILYSVMQIWVLMKNQISKIQIFAFPIIYITFSMFWEYLARGYTKNWSPATQAEATYQNVVCMLILSFIVFAALFTTFKRRANV